MVISENLDKTKLTIVENYDQINEKINDIENKLKDLSFVVKKEDKDGCNIIYARNKDSKNHIIFQSGLHGIEGYVGFEMIYHLTMNILEKIFNLKSAEKDNSQNMFDITYIINANPFGVKNKRRVNENNVDLNRNFLLKDEDFINIKDDYYLVDEVINPKKKIKDFNTIFNILRLVVKIGTGKFKHVLLSGQRYNTNGVYYMGDGFQKQTIFLKNLYQNLFSEKGFENTIFIDLHTGYGPSYQMSVVNSSFMKLGKEDESVKIDKNKGSKTKNDNIKSDDIVRNLMQNYPLVVQSNTDSFYEMKGDLIDYIYKVYPSIKYATSFEFGTFGDSVLSSLKSVVAIVLENQYFYNNLNGKPVNEKELDRIGKKVLTFYEKAYFPKKLKWWKKAILNFELAIELIFKSI
ncbi:MAG: M14 family metallopeptidase [Spirochaetota bacterium]